MTTAIQQFVKTKKNIFTYFECENDYPIKPYTENKWEITGEEESGIYFLTFLDENGIKATFVIAKNNGQAMIFEKKDYTLVVAIDCVKIGFIFDNRFKGLE